MGSLQATDREIEPFFHRLLEYGGELTAMTSSKKVPRDQGFPATFDACHVFFTIVKY